MADSVVKAFVHDNGRVSISCPSCNILRSIQVRNFRNKRHVLNVKCTCSAQFKVHLEFRKHFRKDTDLSGMYFLLSPTSGGGKVRIKDISRSGLRFSVSGKHAIRTGSTAKVTFTLDNRKATELVKKVVVRNIEDNLIGCEFLDDRAFEKELGFYLRA